MKGVQKRDALYDLHNSPSFDERLAKAVERKKQELKELEKIQKERIRDAIEVGHQKSTSVSPLLGVLRNPPDNAERTREILEERQRVMASVAREYFRKRDDMLQRQQNRTPLFSCEAVEDRVHSSYFDDCRNWTCLEIGHRNPHREVVSLFCPLVPPRMHNCSWKSKPENARKRCKPSR